MLLTFCRKIEVTVGGLAALRVHHNNNEIRDLLWNMGSPYVPNPGDWLYAITTPKVLFVIVLSDSDEYSIVRREWWVNYSASAALTIEVIS